MESMLFPNHRGAEMNNKEHERLVRMAWLSLQLSKVVNSSTDKQLKGLTVEEASACLSRFASEIITDSWRKKYQR